MPSINIHKFKFNARTVQRVGLPFDVAYLVPTKYRGLIPRMLPHAFVVPINEVLAEKLRGIELDEVKHFPLLGKESSSKTPGEDLSFASLLGETPGKWMMVIPSLVTAKGERAGLMYLVARSWLPLLPNGANPDTLDLADVLTSAAYLVTPDSSYVNPVCNLCPKQKDNLAGRCSIGQPVCIQNLAVAQRAIFVGESE